MILSVVVRVQGRHSTDFCGRRRNVISLGHGVGAEQRVLDIPSAFLTGMYCIKSMNFYYRSS